MLFRLIAVGAILAGSACRRPSPPMKLEAAVRDGRSNGPCAAVIAQEWPVGWPVPVDAAGGRRFKIFFYPLRGAPPAAPRLATPTAEAVVDADSGLSVECRVLPEAPRDVAGPRWTPEARKLGARDFAAKARELDVLTESVAAAYASRRPPSAADADLARRYLELFEMLAEPPFMPDYYRLNPGFWEWVRGAAGRSIGRPR